MARHSEFPGRALAGSLARPVPQSARHPAYLQAQEKALIKAFDANDWIYQTWAYDRHDGDYVKALRAIKAKTLIMTGTKDLLNPEWESGHAAHYIRDVRVETISRGTVTGHASASGAFLADYLNREISQFLDLVTDGGRS